ncbi:MAG: hypothetical protein AAF556_04375 [Pseudomonadota bacterium]
MSDKPVSDKPKKQPTQSAPFKMPKENPPFGLAHMEYPFQQRGKREFNKLRRQAGEADAKFVSHIAEKYSKQLKSNGITDEEIATMALSGVAPTGFVVRRIVPLTDKAGTNEFGNMVLMPQQPFGSLVGRYISDQTTGVKPSRQRIIKLPLPRGPIFRIPRKSLEAVTEARFAIAEERAAEAARREKIRAEKKADKQRRQAERQAERRERDEQKEEKRIAALVAEQEAAEERAELRRRAYELLESGAMEPRRGGLQITDLKHLPELWSLSDEEMPLVQVPGDHDYHEGRPWDQSLIREAQRIENDYNTFERRRKRNKNRPSERAVIYVSGPDADTYGMQVVEIDYTRRKKTYSIVDGEKVDTLRYEGLLAKRAFLKMLADEHGDEIKAAYKLTDCELEGMREGYSPEGLSVHHKWPLGGAGDPRVADRANDFDNLILIPNNPYHTAIHKHLDPQIEHLKYNQRVRARIMMPEGYWFKPTMEYERSGPPKCDDDPVIDGPDTTPANSRPPQANKGGRIDPGAGPR